MAKKKYYGSKGMKFAAGVMPEDVKMETLPSLDYVDAPVGDSWEDMDAQANRAVNAAKKQLAKKKY